MLYSDHFALFQTFSESSKQRCHSEKMKNPRWANKKPKKTQGQISIHFHTIFGKNRLFPGKSRLFPRKIPFYPPKILTTFFQIFASPFSNFHPFPAKIYLPNSLKFVTFCKKPLKYMYFLVKCEKTQEKPKVFQKP